MRVKEDCEMTILIDNALNGSCITNGLKNDVVIRVFFDHCFTTKKVSIMTGRNSVALNLRLNYFS
jgi:hypothetical protein